jgi:hypothetical protein
MKTTLRLILTGLFLTTLIARAANDSIVTAVFSRVSNGYHRQKLPDGTFQREHYALMNGNYLPGASRDRSIDAVKFPQIAGLVAQFLALQNYHLAHDAKSAEILLEISWGTTVPFSDSVYRASSDSFFSAINNAAATNTAAQGAAGSVDGIQSAARSVADAAQSELAGQLYQMQMFEDMRRNANQENARRLGYVEEINNRDTPARFAGAGTAYHDLIADLESERYFLIISAYDFRAAKTDGKLKPLWVTRVSIQAQGNKFDQALAPMLARASRHFGQDSGRLLRQYQPEGRVTLGELKVVGVVSPENIKGDMAPEKQSEPKRGK